MENPPRIKKKSFGICHYGRTSPPLGALSPETKVLNVEISFEEALKLNLAVGECLRKLNSYNRSTVAGKRSGLNLAIFLSRGVITVNEGTLPSKASVVE